MLFWFLIARFILIAQPSKVFRMSHHRPINDGQWQQKRLRWRLWSKGCDYLVHWMHAHWKINEIINYTTSISTHVLMSNEHSRILSSYPKSYLIQRSIAKALHVLNLWLKQIWKARFPSFPRWCSMILCGTRSTPFPENFWEISYFETSFEVQLSIQNLVQTIMWPNSNAPNQQQKPKNHVTSHENKHVFFVSGPWVGKPTVGFWQYNQFVWRTKSSSILEQWQVWLSTNLLLPCVEGVVSSFYFLDNIPFRTTYRKGDWNLWLFGRSACNLCTLASLHLLIEAQVHRYIVSQIHGRIDGERVAELAD